MSSQEFSLDKDDVCNKFIHLTNNAVQKYADNYGTLEKGNQLSFKDFDDYLTTNIPGSDFKGKILPRMKDQVRHSMQSVTTKPNKNSL